MFSSQPLIEKVLIYGSRAKGNFRRCSGIDLTIVGSKLDLAQCLEIESEIEDLLLPYKVDLSLFHQIENAQLIEHIQRVGKVFYSNP